MRTATQLENIYAIANKMVVFKRTKVLHNVDQITLHETKAFHNVSQTTLLDTKTFPDVGRPTSVDPTVISGVFAWSCKKAEKLFGRYKRTK